MKGKMFKKILALLVSAGMLASVTGCSPEQFAEVMGEAISAEAEAAGQDIEEPAKEAPVEETAAEPEEAPVFEGPQDAVILFTSDIHCGVDQKIADHRQYHRLRQIRFHFQKDGYRSETEKRGQ